MNAAPRFQRLDVAFAGYWQAWLEEHASEAGRATLPLTPAELSESINWCEQMQRPSPGTLKRKAEAEADGAPARKPPRQS